ncbi:hypothetical protein D1970_14540 [Mesobacillus zeae]|uniref:YqfQ-like protein n=2 Tax=Mesobacillus zeae TaxID=1917180 RepID=A0A398B8D7_9BACI|nr:hypothetical protein D1970_14540 [Mesobacillus zeae]
MQIGPGMMSPSPGFIGPGYTGFGPGSARLGFPSGRMPGAGPLAGMGRRARQGGGLLARLLGRGNPSGGMASFPGAGAAGRTGGGLLQAFANPGSINGFLANTQQVLRTAQTFGPMVKQYGPLVRNLPSMWKLYRELKNAPDHDSEGQDNEDKGAETLSPDIAEIAHSKEVHKMESPKKKGKTQAKARGASLPKLYV